MAHVEDDFGGHVFGRAADGPRAIFDALEGGEGRGGWSSNGGQGKRREGGEAKEDKRHVVGNRCTASETEGGQGRETRAKGEVREVRKENVRGKR